MEVEVTGQKGVGDGQCNRNEVESGSGEKLHQNVSMFHQILYVSSLRVFVRDIL